MPYYILYIFEMTNAPPWDGGLYRCRLEYGMPVLCVHIRMCKRIGLSLLFYYCRSLEAHGHDLPDSYSTVFALTQSIFIGLK